MNIVLLSFSLGLWASLVAQMVKPSACSAGDLRSVPGSGRSPGRGHGNPLHYCPENPKDRKAWGVGAAVHRIGESQIRLK